MSGVPSRRGVPTALCPVTLELGGKDPMLVLDDADVTRAVGGALWGAFTNAGQVCSGIERAYVAATGVRGVRRHVSARPPQRCGSVEVRTRRPTWDR